MIFEPEALVLHRSNATSDLLGLYNRGFLFERNAFLTAYKNYEPGLWEKLMPALLLTFLYRKMRGLFDRGFVYIAQPPLYRIKRKKREQYVDDDAALNKMLIGHMIPDIITTFGMINMIGGECDR